MPTTLTCFLKQTQLQFAVFGFKLTSDFRYIVSVSNKFITWDVSTSDLARQVHPGKAPVQCLNQRTLTYFVRGNITVWLTSCLTGLASTKLVNLNRIQHKQNSKILTSQTGGQPYSDTSPCKVSECSLRWAICYLCRWFRRHLSGTEQDLQTCLVFRKWDDRPKERNETYHFLQEL